ncbi:modified peptide precursor CbpA [Azospira restricta]|uniref:Modified peptide CbpA n=1 Tax=Azospira restricta TaxID=404405 RepID=A0A974PW89_9RHOO|nr:modified peptide precursor CbpA [Azospira restricta]QRJ62672.1 modified peptide precursor CbpA [Azospira restricta]
MTQTIQAQQTAQPQTAAAKGEDKPVAPSIATRKSCNPDGIGLSHYVLMDKKAAK